MRAFFPCEKLNGKYSTKRMAYIFRSDSALMITKHILENPFAHIDLHNPNAVRFFCEHFDCSEEQLKEAVHKIGRCPEEVRIFLQAGGSSKRLFFRLLSE